MADQIPVSFQQCVFKAPLTVAANLRYFDANGDLVDKLFPLDYISLTGASTSNLIVQVAQIDTILSQYSVRITALESAVNTIQTSGVTFMLYVNGGCFSSPINTTMKINDAVTSIITNSCAYNTTLGTTTALASSISALGIASLNALPAYSQNSIMSGLTGWKTTLSTTADLENNLALAYLDARAGITQALSQSAITCADVKIVYAGVYNISARTITVYFYSSSIPANFSGSGSSSGTFTITDTAGNTYTQTFNLYTTVGTGSIVLNIASSALLQNSSYTSLLTYALTSTTPALGCNGGIPGTVVNNTQTCPNTTATALSSTQVQFSFTPTVLENAVYTVDLLNTSGVTSGTTVIATKTYTNPTTVTTDQFNNLTTHTTYYVRVSVTINTVTTVCPSISVNTS